MGLQYCSTVKGSFFPDKEFAVWPSAALYVHLMCVDLQARCRVLHV